MPNSSLFSIFLTFLTFTLNEKIVFITEKWVKSSMRDTEKIPVLLQGYFCGIPQKFPLNIIYRKIKIFKLSHFATIHLLLEAFTIFTSRLLTAQKPKNKQKKDTLNQERLTTIP
ncbi:hypothetical protein P9B58_18525 [Bacillus mojavensis]|uniref:hypothetical protein n=1 Tax=Bacillus mojavensis TaxID=72360 RepID=UPI002DBDAC0C|nr:hypothetical protein [Bacillus mojavensis]MEC1292156.1 hypothetical protein [Bacillus mojavensis]MEC1615100.1 hypothetical protein [Bacillus mojavensis]MEC1692179.1 hypothetical protein [Bacillus mojavensis]MEC1706047.1 hypothetical protein [Bacillus mojavensis]MEC5248571.1 hypothetical protein [Bacillus mojavensis]